MAESSPRPLPLLIACLFLLCSVASPAHAKSPPRPITENEIREKKKACYEDIERSSVIEKENCALRCLSPPCFDLVYGSDPIEEGEKDFVRSQEFKYCLHKLSIGESLEGVKGAFDY